MLQTESYLFYRKTSRCRRALATSLVLCLLLACCLLGGFLNRCRGGYVDFGSMMGYWPAHVTSRLIVAVPTGLVVWLASQNFRAGLSVCLMTWFSLYVGWGPYMSMGEDTAGYNSRSGVFDWALGRQMQNWSYPRRVVRDYTGMSLRGLIWTTPQGYVLYHLGLGWCPSLSGSLMGLVYFAGNYGNTPLCKSAACSEYLWGIWVWLVLLTSSLYGAVTRARSTYPDVHPESSGVPQPSSKLESTFSKVVFELFHFVFGLILGSSTCYYALVEQEDWKNKGQTFFGLFTGFGFLVSTQFLHLGMLKKKRERSAHVHGQAPVEDAESTTLLLSPSPVTDEVVTPHPTSRKIYEFFEINVELSVFKWLHLLLGVVSFLGTIVAFVLTIMTLVWNIHTPRFLEDTADICNCTFSGI
ncbi:Hypp6396 [Branchiostoma lanceolatum]|nr:Hypp6396 [Branchiostoma lanceolatum]